jgi:CRP/FNR family transcriptional regulator, cyclic AMP receptor protein
MSAALRAFIQSSAWGTQLAESELQRVLASAREAVVPRDSCVVRAGDRADHWVGLMDGIVVQMVVSADGDVTVLTAAGAGAWFGEGTLMKQGRWGYDAIARKESKVALVPAATFRWLMEVSLPFNQFIARLLNERLSLYMGLLANERLTNVEQRLARVLASLFNPALYPSRGRSLRISQSDIALLAGLSRQRANTALQKLQQAGCVDLARGGLTVVDLDGLRNY